MKNIDILLIITCAAGLVHGLTLSIYIGFVKNKRTFTDVLLAILLVLMAFRVGKSIVFQFNNTLEILFIFLGLSTLVLIGPVLNWYIKSILIPNFKLSKTQYFQVAPFFLMLGLSFFLTKEWFIDNGKYWVYIILFSVYSHLAFYIYLSFSKIYSYSQSLSNIEETKSQKHVLIWLKFVVVGITIIWISYVLNIFENSVPYVIGPILYSVCIYVLTFKGYKLKIFELNLKLDELTTEGSITYKRLVQAVKEEELYLESDLSLNRLGQITGYSNHKISATINEFAKTNFNDFINSYRVKKAKSILADKESKKYKISSIAYDSGFSTLSSFNTSFKKFEKTTPSSYRNSIQE